MDKKKFDLVIIGGGPGGYVAAIRAAQLKLSVALVEKEHLGGICLNWGCIPTKALLKSAEMYRQVKHVEEFGIEVKDIKFNLSKIVDRSRKVSKQLSSGISTLMKKNNVTVFNGHARILGNNEVEVTGDSKSNISAKNIIIATGARARILPGFEPDNKFIWTYKEAMVPKEMPKSLIIVGSGAIGMEFAYFYNTMGVKVTVIESRESILNTEDHEISEFAKKEFTSQGINFIAPAKIVKVEKEQKQITLFLSNPNQKIKADRIIMAVGITANIENIGLDKVSIKTENGHIVTNEYMQTSSPHIYAIGDVAGAPWLAHKASHEGIIAAEKIANLSPHKISKNNIPACIYTHPQIASIGITEQQAIKEGRKVKIGRFPFMGNGKAIASGETKGMIKTIFDTNTGELLGAHMIGAGVTELIQGFAIGKNMEATELDFMNSIFPHPTLSEMMHESVLNAYDRALHI